MIGSWSEDANGIDEWGGSWDWDEDDFWHDIEDPPEDNLTNDHTEHCRQA
jgi:hypothetical protein